MLLIDKVKFKAMYEETKEMMTSPDYKERFKAEFIQLCYRIDRLEIMLNKYALGKLEFTPTCPVTLLQSQLDCMREYKHCLMERIKIEKIDIE